MTKWIKVFAEILWIWSDRARIEVEILFWRAWRAIWDCTFFLLIFARNFLIVVALDLWRKI